jgi:hypothetical protein
MKKSLLAGLAILLLATTTLPGCILVPVDDGYNRGESHERERGDHHGDHHDRHEDHDERR